VDALPTREPSGFERSETTNGRTAGSPAFVAPDTHRRASSRHLIVEELEEAIAPARRLEVCHVLVDLPHPG
jgi:hypothetical protein